MVGQETLIYIEENDQLDAGVLAKGFAKEDVKNRAYINALGAQLAKKYLTSENIDVSNTYNLHSIHKILEEIDIADIMLSNIHIDVRVIFNEEYIFIPKSHFELEIIPDIYFVFSLSHDKSYVKFLGFFEPKLINKNNQNEDYYFIEKEKLTSPLNLKEYISNFNGNTSQELSSDNIALADTMMVSMIDHDINENDKKELLNNLIKSADLRDRFIEFENFELLSYKAQNSPEVKRPVADEITANFADFNMPEELSELSDIDSLNNSEAYENIAENFAAGMTGGIIGGAIAGGAAAGAEAISSAIDEIDTAATIADAAIGGISDTAEFAGEVLTEGLDFIENIKLPSDEETVEDTAIEPISENSENDLINLDEFNDVSNDIETIGMPEEIEVEETLEEQLPAENLVDETENLTIDEITTIDETTELETFELPAEETLIEDNLSVLENENETEIQTETDFETSEDIELSPDLDISALEETTGTGEELPQETLEMDSIELEPMEGSEELNLDALTNDDEPVLETFAEETQPEPEITSEENLSLTEEEPSLEFDTLETINESFSDELEEPSLEFETSIDELETSDNEVSYINEEEESENSTSPKEPVILRSTEETVNFDDINTDNLEPLKASNSIMEETVNFDDINLNEETELELEDTSTAQELGLEISEDLEEETSSSNGEEIAELDLEADDIGAVEAKDADDDIDIDDLKDIGIDVEELPASGEEVSSSELISQIDDLLNEEEIADETEPVYEENTETIEEDSEPAADGDFLTDEDMASAVDADNDKLEMLFSTGENYESVESLNSDSTDEEFDGSEAVYNQTMKPEQGKKGILVAAAVVALLAVTAGTGMFLFKGKNSGENLAQNAAENEVPSPGDVEQTQPATINPDGTPDNTNLMTNTPDINKLPAPAEKTAKDNKELKNTAPQQQTQKPAAAMPYVSVNKVMWEVPDYLSYSDKIKDYLQTAGKSIKLTLNSDLLLANEYAYSNQVKVDLKLRNDGSIVNAQIVKSSGSNEINDIVLRTVKETLNVVKPASGEVPTPDFKLGLIIYF